MSDFDTMLWRPLRSGNEYDALFPVTSCKSTYVGDGNTDFSIDEMEKVIEQYAFQTTKVAPKLQKSSLKATTDSIHDFLFNHFQYLADESNQLLRSPACSWFTRKKGIDCKSYSILASCLLLNLDITHYIRKIKQPGYAPNDYTHVYVVVPKDQDTGNLQSGYYVIDGTLKNNIEPAYIGKNDTRMNGLKHYALNGSYQPTQTGLNAPIVTKQQLNDLAKKPSISKIVAIFQNILCGNSAYTEGDYNTMVAKVGEFYSQLILRLNTAILDKNFLAVSKEVALFAAHAECFKKISVQQRARRWRSNCTERRLDGNVKMFTFYDTIVRKLLMGYMDEYFTKISGNQTAVVTSQGSDTNYGFKATNEGPFVNTTATYNNVQPKNVNIPPFSIPQMVLDKTNSGTTFSLENALELMEAVGTLIPIVTGNSNPPNQSGGAYVDENGVKFNPDGTKTQTAGMGMWVGGAILIAGIAIATTKFKNKH